MTTTTFRPPLVHLLVAAAAALYAWAVVVATIFRLGTIGLDYDAPGTDYMVFHTAVSVAWQGDLTTLYDPDRFTALLNRIFHASLKANLEFRPWIYPPTFLLLLIPFGLFVFVTSYALFQFATGAAMLGSLRQAGFAALLCPAASISVISGQCSFLVVALLAGGSRLLDRRPVLAGVMLGVLNFKPQFFLMVPVALLARSAWRASAVATVTILLMSAACLLVFGPAIWTGWFAAIARSTSDTDPRWFQSGRLWGFSVYTCVYLLGAPRALAEATQIAAALLAAGVVWTAFRHPVAPGPRAAALLAATFLAAPHAGAYDLVLPLAAAALLLLDLGPRATSWDWTLVLLIWFEPMIGLPVLFTPARFCPVLTVALLGRIAFNLRLAVPSRMPSAPLPQNTRG